MAIILPGGFNITNNEPVDARLTVADQSARLGFSTANVYEGLLVYQQDNNQLYVLTDASNPSLDISWTPVISFSSGSGDSSRIVKGSVTASVDEGNISFNVASSSVDLFTVNNSGVMILKENSTTPNYVSGGFWYSSSGEWFLS